MSKTASTSVATSVPQAVRPPSQTEIAHLFMLGEHELQHGRLAEALILYRFVKTIAPDHIDAAARFALTLFRREQWAEAWDAFDIRFSLMPAQPRVSARDANGDVRDVPRWRGGPVPTKLLVMDEQGLGDTIQFARFLKPLVNRGVDVSFVTHPALFDLLKSMQLPIRLIRSDEPGQVSGIGGWTALVNLPRALALHPDSYAAHEPYLKADPVRVKIWAKKLKDKAFKIGIVWAGNPESPADKGRSIALETLAPLAKLDGVRLYSLQKGEAAKELKTASFRKGVTDFGSSLDQGEQAFLDTAAIIQSLDLIVAVDTAVAHLAGALGKPVCLLLRKDPDWRWLARETDTVWYPKTTLYRQRQAGDWTDPVQRLVVDIAVLTGKVAPPRPGTMPLIPVSVGDLVDRITILNLKLAHANDVTQAMELKHHADMLDAEWRKLVKGMPVLSQYQEEIAAVNAALWIVEDQIREAEARQTFDDAFVALARSVYELNDRRAALKRKIDDAIGSRFREVKTYAAQAGVKRPAQAGVKTRAHAAVKKRP